MLFGSGARFSGMFATHPPLTDRIRALDPSFTERDYPQVSLKDRDIAASAEIDQRTAGIAQPPAANVAGIAPATISASVGQPTQQHIALATYIRRAVPDALYDAAHSPELSYLLAIALVLDQSEATLGQQQVLVTELLGEQRARLIFQLYRQLQEVGLEFRLPLLEIAFPALRQRPAPQLQFLIDLTARLIEIDGDIELYEFCFYRILASNLRQVMQPSKAPRRRRAKRQDVRDAAVELLRVVAQQGHEDPVQGAAAFHSGLSQFGGWGESYEFHSDTRSTIFSLEQSLDQLVSLNAEGRQMLLGAVTQVVLHDDQLTLPEAELVRTICASLEIPLPPQIGVSLNSIPEPGS
jgi:hypothetical protein